MLNPWLEILVSSLKEGALITLIDVPVAFLLGLFFSASGLSVLGLILLLESVVLMLLGGAVEMGGTASVVRLSSIVMRKKFDWSPVEYKKVQARGAFYSLVGVMFFVESLALAVLTTTL